MRLNNNTIIFSMILHPLRSWFDFYCYYYISIYEKFKKSLLSNPLQRVIYTIYQECFWNIQSAFTWMNLIEINNARYNTALRLICNLVTCDKRRHAKKCRFFVIKKKLHDWLISTRSIHQHPKALLLQLRCTRYSISSQQTYTTALRAKKICNKYFQALISF